MENNSDLVKQVIQSNGRMRNLQNADLSNGVFPIRFKFTDVNLEGANLSNVFLTRGSFTRCNLKEANMSTSNFEKMIFSGNILEDADFTHSNLTGCDLKFSNLQGVRFTDANLSDTDLTIADLTDADLTRANLTKSQLIGSNLSYAHLEKANFTNANLRGTTLIESNLQKANFTNADLTEANLTGADLTGAILTDAIMTDVVLTGVNMPNLDELISTSSGSFSPNGKSVDININIIINTIVLEESSKAVTIPATKTAIDPLEGEVNIRDFLKEDRDNIVFYRENEFFPFHRQDLVPMLDMKKADNSIVFICKETGHALSITREFLKDETPYFKLRTLGMYGGYANASEIKAILEDVDKNQVFYISTSEEEKPPSVVSWDIYINGADATSGSHCQEGQTDTIYKIEIAKINELGSASGGRKGRNKWKTMRKKRRGKTQRGGELKKLTLPNGLFEGEVEGKDNRLMRGKMIYNKNDTSFSPGNIYEGEFVDGKPNGYGKVIIDAEEFTGYWVDGKMKVHLPLANIGQECKGDTRGSINMENFVPGRVVRLSDGNCYNFEEIVELYNSNPDHFISPMTRKEFNASDTNLVHLIERKLEYEKQRAGKKFRRTKKTSKKIHKKTHKRKIPKKTNRK